MSADRFSFWMTLSLRPLLGLCPWTPLGDFSVQSLWDFGPLDPFGYSQWRREGGKGWHAPWAALCRGRHVEGRNMEYWNLAACSELAFAFQTVIFLHSLTLPHFLDHTP